MNVLVAEDDVTSGILLRRAIERAGHTCVLARDGLEAWNAYQNAPADVIVTDWMMPKIDGIKLCRLIRAANVAALTYSYIIFVTALDELERFQHAMEVGADDYLSKPLNMLDLQVRLHVAGRITSLYHEVAQQRLQLAYQATHDPLTDLPNRTLFTDRLGQALRSGMRERRSFAVLLLDLNRFKEINDTLGHDVGDLLLKGTARRLKAALRGSDTVARLGGDEFAIVLPGVEEAGAIAAAEKIVAAMRPPHMLAGQALDISPSIGIALYPRDGDDESVLLRNADIAMYAAKRSGGGYRLYSSALGTRPGA